MRAVADLVGDAMAYLERGDKSGPDWVWMWMSQEEKDQIDRYLVETEDPLAYMPGTQEGRWKLLVNRIAK